MPERLNFLNFALPLRKNRVIFLDELSLHIEYLLHRHDCVILPGIGALLVSTTPACVAEDMSTLTPAVRQICFNAALRRSDGLLAASYARRMQISFEDAQTIVSRLMLQISEMIAGGQTVALGRIGTLRATSESSVEFMPSDSLSLETRYFQPVRMSKIGRKKEISEISIATDRITRSRKFDCEKNYYVAINKTFARVAAIFCLVVLAAVSVYYPSNEYHNSAYRTDQASLVPVKMIADISRTVVDTMEREATSVKVESDSTARYYLIVASLRSAAEANQYVSGHADSNLQVVGGKKIHRVYAAKSDDRDSLLKIMRSADFKSRYSDAWIWTK